jgi:hypothetical protein
MKAIRVHETGAADVLNQIHNQVRARRWYA